MEITPSLSIPDDELSFSFIHSSGPGGQKINKSATAVQLRFDVRNSPSLPAALKERVRRLAGSRITKGGMLVIEAKRYRTQEQNRTDAINRLKNLLKTAEKQPRVRRSSQPSLSIKIKRMETKKKRGVIKKQRRSFVE
jgi:ribosome-associated protein